MSSCKSLVPGGSLLAIAIATLPRVGAAGWDGAIYWDADPQSGTFIMFAEGWSNKPEEHAWLGWNAVSARILAPAFVDESFGALPSPGVDEELLLAQFDPSNCPFVYVPISIDVEARSGSTWFTIVGQFGTFVNACSS